MKGALGPALCLTIAVVVAIAAPADAFSLSYLALVWNREGSGPLLTPGLSGSWDDFQVVVSTVLLVNGTYHMWFSGCRATLAYSIGHATSLDRIHWDLDPGNPVISGAWNPIVIHEGGLFKMWYQPASGPAIDYASSTDGSAWSMLAGNPVFVGGESWDAGAVDPGPVLHDASGYHMWFSGTRDLYEHDTGLAHSADGLTWTEDPANPVITAGAYTWDLVRVRPLSVLFEDSTYVLWLMGTDVSGMQRIGVGVSTNGTRWTLSRVPALNIGSPSSWDGVSLSRGSVVREGDTLRMWYSGATSSGGGFTYSIGMATTQLALRSPTSPPSQTTGVILGALGTAGGAALGAGIGFLLSRGSGRARAMGKAKTP